MSPVLDVDGRRLTLSSLERVIWPVVGMTKGEMIDYYARIATILLPYISGRPLTLHRFPQGVAGASFYQTRCPPHPEWVRTQRMHVFRSGKEVDAPVLDDVAGLLWAANLSTVELHPYLAHAETLDSPDFVVFDLDPGSPADVFDACEVASLLHGLLDGIGLSSNAKTSGGKGIHVYVPIAGHSYAESKSFARTIARILASQYPDRVEDRMDRSLRAGKVFLDWSQNDPGKSTVAPYSLRGLELPTVSTPLMWQEIDAALTSRERHEITFGPGELLDRVERLGDVFAGVLTSSQRLPTDDG